MPGRGILDMRLLPRQPVLSARKDEKIPCSNPSQSLSSGHTEREYFTYREQQEHLSLGHRGLPPDRTVSKMVCAPTLHEF